MVKIGKYTILFSRLENFPVPIAATARAGEGDISELYTFPQHRLESGPACYSTDNYINIQSEIILSPNTLPHEPRPN